MTSSKLIDIVRKALPSKYKNIREYTEEVGGTRATFLADWGPADETRIVKVDKEPSSPRAIRHVSRGYTTRQDLETLATLGKDSMAHHVTTLSDYEILPDGTTITVEPFFYGSKSLKRRVAEKPLDVKEFEQVFTQVLEAERYLMNERCVYHRDMSPSNILVRDRGPRKGLEVMVTDLANATFLDDVTSKPLPTAGAHMISDPLLFEVFTGKQRSYGIDSEMYAIGMNMLFALTGKQYFDVDPDKGKIDISLPDGIGPNESYSSYPLFEGMSHRLHHALEHELPKNAKKYRHIIDRCLTLDQEKRYKTIGDLVRDFQKASRPSFVRRLWKPAAVLATTLSIGLPIANYHWLNLETKYNEALVEEGKYKVSAMWQGNSLDIVNNLVEMRVAATASDLSKKYPDGFQSLKKQHYLSVKTGDHIDAFVDAFNIPRLIRDAGGDSLGESLDLEGAIYVEGTSIHKDVRVWSTDDSPISRDAWDTRSGDTFSFVVPQDIYGTKILAIELYAPKNDRHGHLRLERPNQIIARKRIPVVFNNPNANEQMDISSIETDIQNPYLVIHRLDQESLSSGSDEKSSQLGPNITFNLAMPAFNYLHSAFSSDIKVAGDILTGTPSTYTTFRVNAQAPAGKSYGMLRISANSKDGNEIYATYLPLQAEGFTSKDHSTPYYTSWKLHVPDRNFEQEIQKLSKK